MTQREPVDQLVRASGLSRRAFAREHGVGEQVLLRLSQGRFSRIPESIETAIENEYKDNYDSVLAIVREFEASNLQHAYELWRGALPKAALPTDKELEEQDQALSPAARLAAAVGSMSKLAKVTHTHDYVVRRYVHGETRELPASMRDAMEAQKWPHTDQLDRAQQQWLDRQGAK